MWETRSCLDSKSKIETLSVCIDHFMSNHLQVVHILWTLENVVEAANIIDGTSEKAIVVLGSLAGIAEGRDAVVEAGGIPALSLNTQLNYLSICHTAKTSGFSPRFSPFSTKVCCSACTSVWVDKDWLHWFN